MRRTFPAAALAAACAACAGPPSAPTPDPPPLPLAGREVICRFDANELAFAGSPIEQARCLMRPPAPGAAIPKDIVPLPAALETRIGRGVAIPRDALRAYVAALGRRESDLGGPIDGALARAHDGDPQAPQARYFVIHDTSTPFYGDAPFPPDIDRDPKVDDLTRYAVAEPVAHVFVARDGDTFAGHDFSVPWRATKLESRVVGLPAKGLFLHVETQQPRRSDPAFPKGNDRIAPVPGFSAKQYEVLALLYVIASVRAGEWLIPAFHAAIDSGLPGAHDDPQNFDLAAFAAAVERIARPLEAAGG